jgi:hypothetical protein
MKKNILLFVTITLLNMATVFAGDRDTVKVGLFVTNLYDFNISAKSFKADFWLWYLYKTDSIKMLGIAELPQSKSSSFSYDYVRGKSTMQPENYAYQKCKADIIKDWDVRSFPFDKQSLDIKLESSLETSELKFLPDAVNSRYDTAINMEDWKIKKFTMTNGTTKYQTTYGDPMLKTGESKYSYINANIELERKSPYMIFFKLLTVLFASFIIICSAFFLEPDNTTRFGVATGSLFAAVSNKNFAASVAPSSNGSTLMDNIHNFTFLCFIIVIGMALYTYHLAKKDEKEKAKKVGRYFIFGLLGIYAIIVAAMVYFAHQAN